MATYYWVGGTGVANVSTNWSLSSGGSGGAGIPTASDDIVIDNNSGSGTIDFSSTNCLSVSVTSTTSITAFTGSANINVYGSCSILKANFCNYTTGQNLSISFDAGVTPRTMVTVTSNLFSAVTLFDADVTFPYVAPTISWTAETILCIGNSKLTININIFTTYIDCSDTTQLIFGATGRIYVREIFSVASSCSVSVTDYSVAGIFFYPQDAHVASSLSFYGGGHSYPALYFSTTSISSTYPTSSYLSLSIYETPTFYKLQMDLGDKINLRIMLETNITITNNMAFLQLASTTTYRQYLQSSNTSIVRSITVNPTTTFGTISQPVAYRLYVEDINVVNPSRRVPAFISNGCVDGGSNTNWDFGSSGFPILLR